VLAHERTQLLEQLAQAQLQARTAEASVAAVREQLQQLHDQRDDLRRQRDGAYTRNEHLEDQVAALRTELAQKTDQHTAERDELLAHLRATEDRALAEVDRARQALQQLQHSATTQARQHQRELSELSTARQQAEIARGQALHERDIQRALANAYASQLERLGDLPEQVRAALTPAAAPARPKPTPARKPRSR
jgi:chromosome segregation ATPase